MLHVNDISKPEQSTYKHWRALHTIFQLILEIHD